MSLLRRVISTIDLTVSTLPVQPGVYIFRNPEGMPLYVGKAKSLHRRIRSYFCEGQMPDVKISQMLASAGSIETIITRTEGEALDLENRLIKQMAPGHNILLRDDKDYPYIKLAIHHEAAAVRQERWLVPYGEKEFSPKTELLEEPSQSRRHRIESCRPFLNLSCGSLPEVRAFTVKACWRRFGNIRNTSHNHCLSHLRYQ